MLQHGTSGHKRNVGLLFVGERRRGGSNKKNKSTQKHIYKTYKTLILVYLVNLINKLTV